MQLSAPIASSWMRRHTHPHVDGVYIQRVSSMKFDWDPAKSRRNFLIHGIGFADAATIFSGPTFERLDDRADYGEERWLAVGVCRGLEVTVIYTDRLVAGDEVRWIISARWATRHERKAFYDSIGK